MYEFRQILKALRADWKTALAVCVNLAVGIGAVVSAFAMVDGLLLSPLPIRDPGSFFHIQSESPSGNVSHPTYDDIRAAAASLIDLAGYSWQRNVNMDAGGSGELLNGLSVSENYFRVLGVGARAGRVFAAGDAAGAPAVVVSRGVWDRFGFTDADMGKPVRLNGESHALLGVVGSEFKGTQRERFADFWILRDHMNPKWPLQERNLSALSLFGRTEPGVAKGIAHDELNRIGEELKKAYPSSDYRLRMKMLSDLEWSFSRQRSTAVQYIATLVLSAMLLVISVFNAKSLLLAQADRQRHDVAVRLAIGASPRALFLRFLAPPVLITFVSGFFALCLAYYVLSAMNGLLYDSRLDVFERVTNPRMVLFVAIVCLATGLSSGLAPALSAARMNLPAFLQGRTVARGNSRFGSVMCALQVGLAFALLVVGGLLVGSLRNAWSVQPGYDGSNLALLRLDFRHYAPLTVEERLGLYRTLRERLKSMPDVVSTSWGGSKPLSGSGWTTVRANGSDPISDADSCKVDWLQVGPSYFETLGVRLLDGRTFIDPDFEKGFNEVDIIVNRAFADRYWPGESVIGRMFYPFDPEKPQQRIIGVVENFRNDPVEPIEPHLFTPARGDVAVFHIRTARDPALLKSEIRDALNELLPGVPPLELITFDEQLKQEFRALQAGVVASAGLGLVGLLLTAFGIFGFMFQWVTAGRREIAIRKSVGASNASVFYHVARKGFALAFFGLFVGCLGAIACGRYLADTLYEMSPSNPWVIVISGASLLVVVAVALGIPTAVAVRMDPWKHLAQD